MKKTYITPTLLHVNVACGTIIALSELGVNSGTTVNQQYIKSERTSNPGYNVWDDDWSN